MPEKNKVCLLLRTTVFTLFLSGISSFAQESAGFFPSIFWGGTDKGVLLTSPAEMEILDINGVRYGNISATGQVLNAFMSPDGNKVVYVTATGLWLAKLGTAEHLLVTNKGCDYLRWDNTGSGFVFAFFEKTESKTNIYKIKMFRADGDGKNVKQVYP